MNRKQVWYRVKGWILGGLSVYAFVCMASRVSGLFVSDFSGRAVLLILADGLAWLGFSYLYLTRR